MFDTNQDLEQAGSQSAFGQPITNGVTGGTSQELPDLSRRRGGFRLRRPGRRLDR